MTLPILPAPGGKLVGDDVEVAQHMHDRAVPVSGLTLRAVYFVIDLEVATGVAAEHLHDAVERRPTLGAD